MWPNVLKTVHCSCDKPLDSLREVTSPGLIMQLVFISSYGGGRGVHGVLVGKPEGKRPLGRPRRIWEDNIKMDLQEVGGGRGDLMELAEDTDGWGALVGTVRNFRVP